MKHFLITAILLQGRVAFSQTIIFPEPNDYKNWDYIESKDVYMIGTEFKGYVGWVGLPPMEQEKGKESIVYMYVADFTEGMVSRMMQALELYCDKCEPIALMSYMPSGYSITNPGDVYLAAKLDRGYVTWEGDFEIYNRRARVVLTVSSDSGNMLYMQYYSE